MQFIVSSLLPYITCIAMVAIGATIFWSNLSNPWAFVIFGFLTLLGIHQVGHIAVEATNFFGASGSFLERQGPVTAESIEQAQSALLTKAIKASLFIFIVGCPLLLWLKAQMPKP